MGDRDFQGKVEQSYRCFILSCSCRSGNPLKSVGFYCGQQVE